MSELMFMPVWNRLYNGVIWTQ